MRIKIGDKVYPTVARDEVSLKEMMLFNIQASDFGLTWNEARDLLTKFDGMSAEEVESHPDIFLVLGVTIWMVRRAAGEDLTFAEAVDVDLTTIDYLPDPEDRQPGKAKGAKKKAAKKKAPPKVSGQVAELHAAEAPTSTAEPKQSESRSIPA